MFGLLFLAIGIGLFRRQNWARIVALIFGLLSFVSIIGILIAIYLAKDSVLSRGGLMLFDEYAIPNWPGETRAVDEFIADKPGLRIRTLNWNNTPAGYLVKD